MHLRKDYGNEEIDELFCYFMRTVLRIQKNGAVRIPIDVSFEEPVNTYLKTAVNLMEDAQPPEITELVLQIEYDQILLKNTLTKTQITLLVLIRELSKHIRFDKDMTGFLLSTGNLWNEKANVYATKTFYCNMPLEIQKREGFDFILKNIPESFLEPDNF